MFIQTLLLSPSPLVAFQLPLDWGTRLPLQNSVRTDLLFWWNCPYPAVFTAATCIVGECCATSCDIHVTQMSTKGTAHWCHCAIPSFKYSPDIFSKEVSEIKMLDHTSISRICLSLPVRPMPSCGFKAQRATHQNQSQSSGNVSGSCHRGFSNSSSVTSSFMKTSRSGL